MPYHKNKGVVKFILKSKILKWNWSCVIGMWLCFNANWPKKIKLDVVRMLF